jgi:hypothetical protein
MDVTHFRADDSSKKLNHSWILRRRSGAWSGQLPGPLKCLLLLLYLLLTLAFHAMCVSGQTYCCGCVVVAVVALERQLSIMASPGKAHFAKVHLKVEGANSNPLSKSILVPYARQ